MKVMVVAMDLSRIMATLEMLMQMKLPKKTFTSILFSDGNGTTAAEEESLFVYDKIEIFKVIILGKSDFIIMQACTCYRHHQHHCHYHDHIII